VDVASDRENTKIIPLGKAPPELLQRILGLPRKKSSAVVVGPSLGEDAAVLNFDAGMVVVTSDPITFPTPRPGYYAIHVNANDVAVMGGKPRFFIMTLIMPPGATDDRVLGIMQDAVEAADALDIVLIGGHSEVSEAVTMPLVSVTMLGSLIKTQPICTAGGLAGDAIIQVKPMAVEGTSILASEHRERLEALLGRDTVERARDFLFDPGLSVLAPAELATRNLLVHAMHDPTEGGLATGIKEIAIASNTGLVIDASEIIVRSETTMICEALGYDPLGLISSGCLIFTIADKEADRALNIMADAGFETARIGTLTDVPGQYQMITQDGRMEPLPDFAVDELARE
jgi:hydrogenase expression/formation protein HypE